MNQYLNYERIKAACTIAKANEGKFINICSYRAKNNWNVMYNGRNRVFSLFLGDEEVIDVYTHNSLDILLATHYIYLRLQYGMSMVFDRKNVICYQ